VDSDLGIDELVVEFVVECREDLDGFDQDVVALEKDPGSRALLDAAFRALHTIKGTSSYFGFDRLEAVTHLGESVLAGLRDEAVPLLPGATADRLDEVTRSLREAVLRTRVEPVERAWSSLPRLVRDLSEASGKRVRLLTEGRGTSIDRTLLAAVKDPMTHLVRNAVDHGIETPWERRAAGKPAEATLTVRARTDQHEVVVEVADDGRGIDVDRVARTALDQGLVTPEELSTLREEEIVALVLRSGLSTAREVTSVSGRGYGLDVVHTDVERAGGSVELVSTPGLGCLVRLRLPHADGGSR
jgi:two-component system chemotaxis sensor kinase CheA